MKKIRGIICKRKGVFVFLIFIFLLFLSIFIFLFCPRSYNSFFRKAGLKEVEEIEIFLSYNGRDSHESVISDKYCCSYLINDKESIERIQKVFKSVSMKPQYTDGTLSDGLAWHVRISGQEDYILVMHSSLQQGRKTGLFSYLIDEKHHSIERYKDIFPGEYKISEEDNEKIIQVLFEAIKDNIKDMTIQDAIRLSEENAEWRKFMYYYMSLGDMDAINQVYIPILNSDMKIEILYYKIIRDTEYVEPIEKAVLYDSQGNEYEYFSEEAREVLRREAENDNK